MAARARRCDSGGARESGFARRGKKAGALSRTIFARHLQLQVARSADFAGLTGLFRIGRAEPP